MPNWTTMHEFADKGSIVVCILPLQLQLTARHVGGQVLHTI